MKKILLIILVAAFLAGCKKNTAPPGQVFLSKVIEDGEIEEEYVYDSEGQLEQIKYYNGASISGIEKYFYKDGRLLQAISYSLPSNKVNASSHFETDASGRIIRRSYYYGSGSDSGELYLHIDHKYDSEGKIVRQTWRSADEKVTSYREFTYYSNGNMKAVESFQGSGMTTEKFYKYSFAASDATIPSSLKRPMAMPVNYYYEYMVTDEVAFVGYEDDAVKYQTEDRYGDRKHDKYGFVTYMKTTTKNILPAQPETVRETRFEYMTR